MNNKIKELKDLLWELDSKHTVSVPDTQENINNIAERIVKLFAIPDVIDTVCDCSIEDFKPDWEKNVCKNCGKIIEY